MFRLLLSVVLVIPVVAARADDAKGEKVPYTVHDGQFEKNNSGLKGDVSYLLIADRTAFDKVFGAAFVMGKKPNVVPNDAFDTKLAAAVIHRGNAPWSYQVEKVTADADTLYIQYKATAGKPSSARFASPLIVTVDKGKIKKAVFVENGKTVGTAEAK